MSEPTQEQKDIVMLVRVMFLLTPKLAVHFAQQPEIQAVVKRNAHLFADKALVDSLRGETAEIVKRILEVIEKGEQDGTAQS